MPKGVFLKENIVFESQLEQVLDLPEIVIRTVVQYYQNDEYLTLYGEKMCTGFFKGIGSQRQKQAIVHYNMLGQDTLRCAISAVVVLEKYTSEMHALLNADDNREFTTSVLSSIDTDNPRKGIDRLVETSSDTETQRTYGELSPETRDKRQGQFFEAET